MFKFDLFQTKNSKLKKSLSANKLVHDLILASIVDRYLSQEAKFDGFALQLFGRAFNWIVPDLSYNLENDINKVDNKEIRSSLIADKSIIFETGQKLLKENPLFENLLSYYIEYELYLINELFPKDARKRYPGIEQMENLAFHLFQIFEKLPDPKSKDFKQNYKKLFIQFNEEYGALRNENIDSLFSLI